MQREKRGKSRGGTFTRIIGITTMALAYANFWLLPYPILMSIHNTNLTVSVSLMIIGSKWKKDLLRTNKICVGLILLLGIVTGIHLLLLASTSSTLLGRLDLLMENFAQVNQSSLSMAQNDSTQSQQLLSPITQGYQQVYDESNPRDMAFARMLWTVNHSLYAVSGVVILLCAIYAALNWSQKAEHERDLGQEQDGRCGNDSTSDTGKQFYHKPDAPLDLIIKTST